MGVSESRVFKFLLFRYLKYLFVVHIAGVMPDFYIFLIAFIDFFLLLLERDLYI